MPSGARPNVASGDGLHHSWGSKWPAKPGPRPPPMQAPHPRPDAGGRNRRGLIFGERGGAALRCCGEVTRRGLLGHGCLAPREQQASQQDGCCGQGAAHDPARASGGGVAVARRMARLPGVWPVETPHGCSIRARCGPLVPGSAGAPPAAGRGVGRRRQPGALLLPQGACGAFAAPCGGKAPLGLEHPVCKGGARASRGATDNGTAFAAGA
jgi:hypothetical protein